MKRLDWRDGVFVLGDSADDRVFVVPHDVDAIAAIADLSAVDVVALVFPNLRDGRAFTQAAALRRAGFRGDIRARGALFLDQIGMAVRCGFTSIETDVLPAPEDANEVMHRYSVYYQRGVMGAPVWEVRA